MGEGDGNRWGWYEDGKEINMHKEAEGKEGTFPQL